MAHSFKQQIAAAAAAAAAALAVVADAVDAEICRTFAVETAATGQREFIVTSAQRFWEHYISVNAKQRHHYEIIRQAHPCNLYFGECLQVLLYMRYCGQSCVSTCQQRLLGFHGPYQFLYLFGSFDSCMWGADVALTLLQ
jgi:hypothetical protein